MLADSQRQKPGPSIKLLPPSVGRLQAILQFQHLQGLSAAGFRPFPFCISRLHAAEHPSPGRQRHQWCAMLSHAFLALTSGSDSCCSAAAAQQWCLHRPPGDNAGTQHTPCQHSAPTQPGLSMRLPAAASPGVNAPSCTSPGCRLLRHVPKALRAQPCAWSQCNRCNCRT